MMEFRVICKYALEVITKTEGNVVAKMTGKAQIVK